MNTTITFSSAGHGRRQDAPRRHVRPPHDSHREGLDRHLHATCTRPGAASATTRRRTRVRFTVTPKPADFEERLEYRFEDPTDNGGHRRAAVGEARRLVPDHGRHEGRRVREHRGPAARPAALRLAGLEPGGQLEPPQRLQARPGPRVGRPLDRDAVELPESPDQGRDPREEGRRRQGSRGAARPGHEGRDRERRQPARLPAHGREEDRRGPRHVPQERQGLSEFVEHLRQPRRGARHDGRQEGRRSRTTARPSP